MSAGHQYPLDNLSGGAIISPRSAHQRSRSGQPDRKEAGPPSDRFRRDLGGRRYLCNSLLTPKQRERAQQGPTGARKECVVSHLGIRSQENRSARISRGIGVVAVAALVFTGCSDNDEIPTTTSTTQVSTTGSSSSGDTTTSLATASTSPTETAVIIDRYKQFWEARFSANQAPPNPDLPALAQFAIGEQLDQVVAETRERRDSGLAIRRPNPTVYKRRVKVVSVDGDKATVQDCVTNDGIVYRMASGEVVDDKIVTRNLAAAMERVKGEWKLAKTTVVQEWEGVSGCARSADFG